MSLPQPLESHRIGLSALLAADRVLAIPALASKEEALRELLHALVHADVLPAQQVPALLTELLQRECRGTSALGKGLAIPHLRTSAVDRFAGAVGIAPRGVDFQSLDGAPTKLIILVLAPYEERQRHLELMGRLWTLLREKPLLLFLQKVRTPREVYDFLVDLDARGGEPLDARIHDTHDALPAASRVAPPHGARQNLP